MSKSLSKIIFGGASITATPWPSWADIVKENYHGMFFNTAKKGLGNEAIITTALHQAYQLKDKPGETIIIVMLTNIDKWDWYVDKPELVSKFSQEKHNLTKLDPKQPGGFWSTGSWFPLEKEVFKTNFYSQDYFVLKTLQVISMFLNVCQTQGWTGHILFDSPIFSTLEADLIDTAPIDCYSNKLINSQLNRWLYDLLKIEDSIYHPGMIGFLAEKGVPWYSKKYKSHPGTRAQYEFTNQIIFPILNQTLTKKSNSNLLEYVDIMDKLWTQ